MQNIDLSGQGLSEKEQKIIEAAIGIFSEKGFSAATTSEIAKRAGIAEGTIFRYFKTKKDILRGILIQAVNMLGDKVVMDPVEKILKESENKDIRTVMKEIIADRLKLVDSFFPMARVLVTEALFHEDVRDAIYTNIIEKAINVFNRFFAAMAEKGKIRTDIDPQTILRCIIGNIGMLIAQRTLFGDKFGMKDMDAEIESVIDVILYGITDNKMSPQE